MGVLRYVAEAGLLSRIATVSSISGGSIAAAALADRWDQVTAGGHTIGAFLEHVDAPFREAVTEKNLRNIWVRRWLSRPWRDRGTVQGTVLADYLYRSRLVADLPPGPLVVIASTDLATGRAFRISREFIGNYDFGYVPTPPQLELGTAVAASAAFPVVFPPVHLPTSGLGLDPEKVPPEFSLTDGGVYDNLGLEWFQGWDSGRPQEAIEPDYLIVADASGCFHQTKRRIGEIGALGRERSIQYRQTTALRIRWLMDDFFAGRRRGVYVSACADPQGYRDAAGEPIAPGLYDGAIDPELAKLASSLRTDLDRFQPEEAALVSYHGYWSAHARIASIHPELAVGKPAWREFATIEPVERKRLARLLRRGQHHFGPKRSWG
jgi:NTE family protein